MSFRVNEHRQVKYDPANTLAPSLAGQTLTTLSTQVTNPLDQVPTLLPTDIWPRGSRGWSIIEHIRPRRLLPAFPAPQSRFTFLATTHFRRRKSLPNGELQVGLCTRSR
jgi:hypothetical protein